MAITRTTSPADAGDLVGRKVFKRRRGEAIEIAIGAGLDVRVHVLKIDQGQVELLVIAPRKILLQALSRQEAGNHARQRRA